MNYSDGRLNFWEDLPPALTNEENIEYLKKYRETNDKNLRDKIVFGNMRLVVGFIKKNGASIYSKGKANTFEDVAQEAAFAISNAIEAYDFDKNIKFSTYACVCIKNMFRNKYRKVKLEKDDVSLNNKVFDDGDDDYIDIIEADNLKLDNTEGIIEYQFIKNNIICLLPKREKEVFDDYFCKDMSAAKIAKKLGISRHYVDKMLEEIREKIYHLYFNGVSDYDKFVKGVVVSNSQEKRIKENLTILKNYNPQFLRKVFVPKLNKDQALIFENMVLNFYGQSYKHIEKVTNISTPNISRHLKSSLKKLYKNEDFLSKQKQIYIPEQNKNQKYIDFVNKVVAQNNGKMFLYKYFVSILPENERKVFSAAVLDYAGENFSELFIKCEMSKEEFKNILTNTLRKLKKYDFDIAVDIIDNAKHYQMSIESLTLEDIKKTKERIGQIKSKGGVLAFKSESFSKLTGIKKQIAQDLYLHPKYNNIESFAKLNNLQVSEVLKNEKEFVDDFLVK